MVQKISLRAELDLGTARSVGQRLTKLQSYFENKCESNALTRNCFTLKTLKIGTPRLTTVAIFNLKQYDFTMQKYLQKM